MNKMNISRHALNDRFDRLFQICMTKGVGEIILVSPARDPQREICMTDTGVYIVRGVNGKIITMFYATYAQAYKLYKGNIPKPLQRVLRENERKGLINKV